MYPPSSWLHYWFSHNRPLIARLSIGNHIANFHLFISISISDNCVKFSLQLPLPLLPCLQLQQETIFPATMTIEMDCLLELLLQLQEVEVV